MPPSCNNLRAAAGFRDGRVRTLAETCLFPSPEALVAAQLAATPLSTLGALTEEARGAVARDVRAALETDTGDGGLAVPMEAHLAFARA